MTESLDIMTWRKLPCLGCAAPGRRHRDPWVEIGGTRTGSWLIVVGVEPYKMMGDPFPPPGDETLFILGVSHRECLPRAVQMLRTRKAHIAATLPELLLDEIEGEDDSLRPDRPATPGTCPFCQALAVPMTDEDIIPRWLLRELADRGYQDAPSGGARQIRGPKTPVCADCNNGWMSVLENDAKKVIVSLCDYARDVTRDEQRTLAAWATLKAMVIDSGTTRLVPRGFGHDLKMRREPHGATRVWIAAYADVHEPVKIIPWVILAEDSDDAIALCITFTMIRVAVQVLIPFVEGTLAPLEDFMESVAAIWPLTNSAISWPPPYRFDSNSLLALARRVYDNREPVQMEVTLHRTVIAPAV